MNDCSNSSGRFKNSIGRLSTTFSDGITVVVGAADALDAPEAPLVF